MSKDLVAWEDWPGIYADTPWDEHGVFSGNCAFNGSDPNPICIYSNNPCNIGVCATSKDGWVTWEKRACMTHAPSPASQTNHVSSAHPPQAAALCLCLCGVPLPVCTALCLALPRTALSTPCTGGPMACLPACLPESWRAARGPCDAAWATRAAQRVGSLILRHAPPVPRRAMPATPHTPVLHRTRPSSKTATRGRGTS